MSLSRKLSLIVSIVVLVGVLILAVISNTYTTKLLSEREEEAGLLLGQSVLSALDSEVDAIKIAVEVIANDPETQRLFYERDRKGLLELYSARYDLLKDDIYQFQFHLPDSTSFLRLHSPEKYGDSLYDIRQTVNEANATGQTVMGLEGGVAGYGVRVVVPMFYNGEAIGSVEFGNRFDDTFLTSTQDQFGGEAYFIYLFDTEAGEDGTIPFLAGTQETDNWPLEPAVAESLYNGEIEYILELRKMTNDDSSKGVQDAISAMHCKGINLNNVKLNVNVWWYHSQEYYERKDVKKEAASELFANMCGAQADKGAIKYIEKYFPNTYKEFWNIINEIGK